MPDPTVVGHVADSASMGGSAAWGAGLASAGEVCSVVGASGGLQATKPGSARISSDTRSEVERGGRRGTW